MDIERLKELRGEVSNVAFIALSKLVDKNARANVVKFGEDLQELIDETIARQSVTDEAVKRAIEWAEQERKNSFRYMDFGDADSAALAIQALRQYQKPTDEAVQRAIDGFEKLKAVWEEIGQPTEEITTALACMRQMKQPPESEVKHDG